MVRTLRAGIAALIAGAQCAAAAPAFAFGPDGHRIAGLLAERRLCTAARGEIAALAGSATLAELGLWADTIRAEPKWRASAPWHYMNVADARGGSSEATMASIRAFRHPPEGDVLEAIGRFRARLGDPSLAHEQRLEALRFLIHFVVDIHQPLHVGRAGDRGGNAIDVRYRSEVVNLHRFWDADVIGLAELSPARYARRLVPRFDAVPTAAAVAPPAEWGAESLALRAVVYDFDATAAAPVDLGAAYVLSARQVTDERLVLAAARLAATLNGLWCGPG